MENEILENVCRYFACSNSERLPQHMQMEGWFMLVICPDSIEFFWNDILLRRVFKSQNFNLIHCFFEPTHLYVETDSDAHRAFDYVTQIVTTRTEWVSWTEEFYLANFPLFFNLAKVPI